MDQLIFPHILILPILTSGAVQGSRGFLNRSRTRARSTALFRQPAARYIVPLAPVIGTMNHFFCAPRTSPPERMESCLPTNQGGIMRKGTWFCGAFAVAAAGAAHLMADYSAS